jgi:para-aminobenzoate synthetase / 4-amino-4-deoxychorismate lyase
MSAAATARLVRERLDGPDAALPQARWLRNAPRAVALSGAWCGGGLVLSSHPVRSARPGEDPFALLDAAAVPVGGVDDSGAVGGGWFGWLGFGLAGRLERIGSPPPRPRPVPLFDLAFHDHVVRCDADGDWWFEALWSAERDAFLRSRLACWRERLTSPAPDAEPFHAEALRVAGAGLDGHRAAVAETVKRIHAGELSQANICLRVDGGFGGDPLDLWLTGVERSHPAYAAFVRGEGHTVVSLSPELFLRRVRRRVHTRPIKGTASSSSDPARLAASVKDRAENVMIVDLMRNDLGRVCRYGSVSVGELCAVEPAAGVWHLVSSVQGELRPGVGDGELVRATFPPGSVTGAPKVHALKTIHELEATAREAYCGAVGLCSPAAGLELNVAIRTFEVAGDRIWLGAGGGIVADSSPEAEVAEALDKVRGLADATGVQLADGSQRWLGPPAIPLLRSPRPDPAAGVIETLRVMDGRALFVADHLERLQRSCMTLGLAWPSELPAAVDRAAVALGEGALRVSLRPDGLEVATRPLPPADAPVVLEPVLLPGGLGAHKWRDRELIDGLSAPGVTPLFCDLDGSVLEAGYAGVLFVFGSDLGAPPLDGRLLPSISRSRVLRGARAIGLDVVVRSVRLDEVSRADGIVLTSSLRGPHAGALSGSRMSAAGRAVLEALRGVWAAG